MAWSSWRSSDSVSRSDLTIPSWPLEFPYFAMKIPPNSTNGKLMVLKWVDLKILNFCAFEAWVQSVAIILCCGSQLSEVRTPNRWRVFKERSKKFKSKLVLDERSLLVSNWKCLIRRRGCCGHHAASWDCSFSFRTRWAFEYFQRASRWLLRSDKSLLLFKSYLTLR